MKDDRQQLLFTRDVLLTAAIGSQTRYERRLAHIEKLREEIWAEPYRLSAQVLFKAWNVTLIDDLAVAREEARQVQDYLRRVQEIDLKLAQLPPAA